jgi:prephenate dehydrogenase
MEIAVKELKDIQITIVGMGLMGASLAGALRGKCRHAVGVARRAESIEIALVRGFIDKGTTDVAEGVRDADIVVLATPVRVIVEQMSELAPLLPEGCLLMDLGSTKGRIVAAMEQLPDHVQPLGGHPMCGKEKSGIEVADPALYNGCTFILSPLKRTSEEALALGHELAEAIGAVPLVLEPERQDYIVAAVSHLPYLIACALVATADATTSQDPAAWEVVATGFRSTSRLAGSDVTMMTDILLTNREEVLKALGAYQEHLGELIHLVETADEEKMREVLSVIRKTRREMYPASQQVIE